MKDTRTSFENFCYQAPNDLGSGPTNGDTPPSSRQEYYYTCTASTNNTGMIRCYAKNPTTEVYTPLPPRLPLPTEEMAAYWTSYNLDPAAFSSNLTLLPGSKILITNPTTGTIQYGEVTSDVNVNTGLPTGGGGNG